MFQSSLSPLRSAFLPLSLTSHSDLGSHPHCFPLSVPCLPSFLLTHSPLLSPSGDRHGPGDLWSGASQGGVPKNNLHRQEPSLIPDPPQIPWIPLQSLGLRFPICTACWGPRCLPNKAAIVHVNAGPVWSRTARFLTQIFSCIIKNIITRLERWCRG